jgi:general secretion pathway protein E
MAIQSALTGHLVFSTLHTNDAASAVTRLLDLGIEPYLLSSSLIGVLAQRLVRQVCTQCASATTETTVAPETQCGRRGSGCGACRGTGYRGRLGIFELLEVDEAIARSIQACAPASQVKSTAVEGGMATLRDDGIAKVRAGLTTTDEVMRVTV